MIDLSREMELASEAALEAGPQLATLGIAEWRRLANDELLGLACGTIGRSGFFEPASRGDARPHVLAGCIEEGTVIDLVAIDIARPSRWARRTGHSLVLGHDAIEAAIRSIGWVEPPEALTLHENPVRWLQAGASGAALISRRLEWEVSALLRDVAEITVATREFARWLERELARPIRMPRIRAGEAAR